MSSLFRTGLLSAALVLASTPLLAQTAPAPAASAAAPGMAMQKDCKSKHDHGAEKGTPTPKSAMCADMAASGAKATAKPKTKAHDHGKVHKGQG
jgi:hypothetical protein